MVQISVKRLDPDLPLPRPAHRADAGVDLYSAISTTLAPGERTLIPTGVAIAVPEGFAAFVHPRSGLALRSGLSVVNTPGTIDAGYRGEVKVLLINHDREDGIVIERGQRIAQLVVQRIESIEWDVVDSLEDSSRGTGGYGSTGLRDHDRA